MLLFVFSFKSKKIKSLIRKRDLDPDKRFIRRKTRKLKEFRLKLRYKRRFLVKQRLFLSSFSIFKSLLFLKKIIFLARNKFLSNNSIAEKFFIKLIKKTRLLSRKLLNLTAKKRNVFRKFRFGFSIAKREQLFTRYKLHRYSKPKDPVMFIDWFLRALEDRGPAYYDLWRHYNRNKKTYQYLRDTYRVGRFGLLFLSFICFFVVFFFCILSLQLNLLFFLFLLRRYLF